MVCLSIYQQLGFVISTTISSHTLRAHTIKFSLVLLIELLYPLLQALYHFDVDDVEKIELDHMLCQPPLLYLYVFSIYLSITCLGKEMISLVNTQYTC